MGAKSKHKKNNSEKRLSHGRAPKTHVKPKTLSSKATKALINRHHTLEKRRKQAQSKNNHNEVEEIDREIDLLGGIDSYQQASLQGQRNDRGGDSSKLLMEWLQPVVPTLKVNRLRMLEIGALSTTNACSKSSCFLMERIDLHSQGEGIIQQDFLARPLPKDASQRFDIISLSLVLNFVPDARERGLMLARTLDFLRLPNDQQRVENTYFPSVFMVLPAPCVLNSRYTDEEYLNLFMTSLGFIKTKEKLTKKLVYYLWTRTHSVRQLPVRLCKKLEVRSGISRNNFAIVLDSNVFSRLSNA